MQALLEMRLLEVAQAKGGLESPVESVVVFEIQVFKRLIKEYVDVPCLLLCQAGSARPEEQLHQTQMGFWMLFRFAKDSQLCL